jgi:hypothetical protein
MKQQNNHNDEDIIIEDIVESDLASLEIGEDNESSEDAESIDESKKKMEASCEDDMDDEDEDETDDEDEDEEEMTMEAEVNSDEEFTKYAMTVLKKAHGDKFDKDKAKATVDGILKKADGNYGDAIGMLTSGLGEGKAVKEDVKVDLSAVSELIESESGLTDEFKSKAAIIFEAEVKSQLKVIRESLQEEYEARLEEETNNINEILTSQIDQYLTYAVEQWMTENSLAIESSLRTDLAENFMSSLKSLFVENYISIPESKVDLLSQVEEEKQIVEDKLNRSLDLLGGLVEKVEELSRKQIIDEACEKLTVTQAAKLQSLAESVEFINEESFVNKVETLKEFYFQEKGGKKTLTEESDDSEVVETIVEGHVEDENLSNEMKQYLNAMRAMNKSVTR